MSRKRKSRPAEGSPAIEEDLSTGVPAEEVLAEGSEEIEAAIVEAVEALADDEPLPLGPEEPSEVLEASAENSADAPAEEVSLAEGAVALADGEGGEAPVAEGEEAEIGPAGLPTSALAMDPVQLKQLIEALIFASDKPLTVQRLRQLTRVADIKRLEATLAEIATDYENRGLILSAVSGGYQFRTRPQFSAWVQQLIAGRPVRLSRAQLETLAIVAYRQPITRPEIDDIRGVDSSATLKLLMDRALIRVLGKKEEVGRPMLYGTTKEFLDFFSLGDLRELPTLREYSELTAESRQVMSDRLGISPDGSDPSGSDGGGGDGGGGSDGGGSDGGGFGGGPADGGSSPADDGTLYDASAADLRDAVELASADGAADEVVAEIAEERFSATVDEAFEEGGDELSADAADDDVSAETRADAANELAADPADEVSADAADHESAVATDLSADASESGAPDGDAEGVQLADGTGAVLASDLDAVAEPDEMELAAGSAQFAAVTDEQLASALAEAQTAPADEPAADDLLVAGEEPERREASEPSQE